MLQVCWSPKGGVGTSVVAAALALKAASAGRETLLVDLDGDQPAILGVEAGDGVGDWFSAPDDVGPDSLRSLEIDVVDRLRLLARGSSARSRWRQSRMEFALALFDTRAEHVVVDAGRCGTVALPSAATQIVITRGCYLSLRRFAELSALSESETRIVLIDEPGRALTQRDVEAALGRVDVTLPWDPAVARAVDAGLLSSRMPRSLRPLGALVGAGVVR